LVGGGFFIFAILGEEDGLIEKSLILHKIRKNQGGGRAGFDGKDAKLRDKEAEVGRR
jgi:hypothetical protein